MLLLNDRVPIVGSLGELTRGQTPILGHVSSAPCSAIVDESGDPGSNSLVVSEG